MSGKFTGQRYTDKTNGSDLIPEIVFRKNKKNIVQPIHYDSLLCSELKFKPHNVQIFLYRIILFNFVSHLNTKMNTISV